ncbi:hypothetical protein B0T44_13210 [Nocardia donostiensis]|uniref:Uncharacterized protein n=1 Tax=Nocardia donostiensis TaxID=1538463 RepID=A0A1W0AV03_9NOCA|nr:hypothetical protein B0T46_09005 [Nocardia donostiensis]OQS14080.1 hypothetical protein B0T36_16175 [Nocardia donostiensis]OQS19759.1 hypothetical protein B0T44_13210 [Nocardia donostiensis]
MGLVMQGRLVRHESSLFMSWQALVVPGRHLLVPRNCVVLKLGPVIRRSRGCVPLCRTVRYLPEWTSFVLMVGGQWGVPRYPVVVTPSFLVQGSLVIERISLDEPERRIVPAWYVGIIVLGPGWHPVVSGTSLVRAGTAPVLLWDLAVERSWWGEPVCRPVPAGGVRIVVLGPGWHLVVSGKRLIRTEANPVILRGRAVVGAGVGEPMC